MEAEAVEKLWLEGESIARIARRYRVRNARVSAMLRSRGHDPTVTRGGRIGRAQRGIPRARASSGVRREGVVVWAYIAGVFDGEGCISTDRRSETYRVTVTQKDLRLLEFLKYTIGTGSVRDGKNAGQYRLSAQREVYDFLGAVEPWLIVKREQAQATLAALETKYGWSR